MALQSYPSGGKANTLVGLSHVWREYDSGGTPALCDFSLELTAGEWLTILGPSGCGKTTLLNLIGGLDLPTRGEVCFNGRRPGNSAEWARLRARHIGFVFQSFNLIATLSCLENVQVPMLGVIKGSRARRQRAEELLDRVGLSHRLGHLPTQISGGERQRVAIARSLANAPSLILADEPTGNLDSESSDNVMALLREIYAGQALTVVLVTHNHCLTTLGSRWLRMCDGRLAEQGDNPGVPPCAC